MTTVGEVGELETTLARIQEEANRLRADPRLTKVSLDTATAELAELERISSQELDGLNSDVAKAEGRGCTGEAADGRAQARSDVP